MVAGISYGSGSMNKIVTLQRILAAGFERGAKFIQKRSQRLAASGDILALCKILMSSRGEISGGAIASRILELFLTLSEKDKELFFVALAEMNPDAKQVLVAAENYAKTSDEGMLTALLAAAEPPRQELFRRLNTAPGGTVALVEMRRLLLQKIDTYPEFLQIDRDLEHLFSSWFNRGFLTLQAINWRTPAHILERIIFYEAIHEIGGWDELRRRVFPEDRRCFGFFHPAMPDEPLIFVEVALADAIPENVTSILQAGKPIEARCANTAIFYSISKCHEGLRGILFGNFLIKQVAQQLACELPELRNFVTLSPAPGLMKWLAEQAKTCREAKRGLEAVKMINWHQDAKVAQRAKNLLLPLAAEYFLSMKRADGFPIDHVARFHLGNGAMLWRINWLADTSPLRMKQSAGIMVNYRYVPGETEDNHEEYAHNGVVLASGKVRDLLKEKEVKTT